MKKTLRYAMSIGACAQVFFAGVAAAGTTDQAREMAQKDYQSAIVKIASVTKSDMLECGARHGPAAKACEIQANGKRIAAEDEARLARDRAGAEAPSSDEERQKAAKRGVRVAKISYGMDKARIAKEDKQARAECNELRGEGRITCNSEVASRTAEANRYAKARYDRSVARAKEIGAR